MSVSAPAAKQLGFAGLGAMGFGMATNLIKHGFAVHGFDVSPHALDKLEKLGGKPFTSAREAAAGQNKFFIMVATPAQADSVIFGDNGAATSLPDSAILCLFSTVPPTYVVELEGRLRQIGRPDIRLLDCPVSGGFVGAATGNLSIMLGGNPEIIDAVSLELEAISAPGRLFPTGQLGSASVIKMINQHLAGTQIVVAAETLALAKSLGLSSRETYSTLMKSEGASWIMGDRGMMMLEADWTPRSAVDIFIKDLGIVTETADALSLACPIASTALQAFVERAARGHGRDDDASVVCNYEGVTGVKVMEPKIAAETNGVSGEDASIAIVSHSGDLQDQFSTAPTLGSLETGAKLHVLNDIDLQVLDDHLASLPEQTFVGLRSRVLVSEETQTLISKHQHLKFFDYEVVKADDWAKPQIFIFSSCHHGLTTAVERTLGANWNPAPVTGEIGSASTMYLMVKLATLIHVAASAECYSLTIAAGASPDLTYQLIAGAAGSSIQYKNVVPSMLSKDFTVNSEKGIQTLAENMKILASLKAATKTAKFPSRLLDAAYQVYKSVNYEDGSGSQSVASLIGFWGHA